MGNEMGSSGLPPLTDSAPYTGSKTEPSTESAYVPCFSKPIDAQRNQGGVFDSFSNSLSGVPSNLSDTFPRIPLSGSLYSTHGQGLQSPANLALPGSVYNLQDQTILRALLENHGSNRTSFKTEREMFTVSQETGLTTDMNPEISSVVSSFDMGRRPFDNQHPPSASAAPLDFESLWNY